MLFLTFQYCYISQGQCNWYISSEADSFPQSAIVFTFMCAPQYFWTFGCICIFGVFKHSNYRARKCLYLVHFAVSEMLLSGTAIKKGAVCLASRDPNQASCSSARLVNASKPSNKHHEDSFRLVSSLFRNFWGT